MAAAVQITAEQVRQYRLAVHHLDHPCPPEQLLSAAGVCGFQNSPPGAWETAAFVRMPQCTRSGLRAALEQEKTLLQAWSYRGAPVVFPAEESAVFLSALAAQPGEEPWIYTRGITLALDFLGMEWVDALALVAQAVHLLDGCTVQSKEELDRVLAAEVATLLPAEQRQRWNAPSMYGQPDRQSVGGAVVSFVLRPCAFLGQVVFGQRQGSHPTFTSFQRWMGYPIPDDPKAEQKLVRKFLRGYGPATQADLAVWLGCTPRQAKRLWQTVKEELVPVQKEGKNACLLENDLPALTGACPAEAPLVLLGAHDPYLDARDRILLLEDTALQRQVWRTVANPNVILFQGRVVGIWKTKTVRNRMDVVWTLFEPLPSGWEKQLFRKVEAYAAFRGMEPGTCRQEQP